jgi:trehalose 6-phosphate synthase
LDEGRAVIGLPEDTFNFFRVERGDYTKGILELIRMIPRFFELHPELRGKVRFIQMAERTRDSVIPFQRYYDLCEKEHEKLIALGFGDDFIWYKGGFPPNTLAQVYFQADAIVVTSHMDGFAMVFAEGMVCGNCEKPPVGIVTRNTGCSDIFIDGDNGGIVVENSFNLDELCNAHARAYHMQMDERKRRHKWICEQIQNNDLHRWVSRWPQELDELARRGSWT